MPKVETVKVVNDNFQSGYMTINKSAFDPEKHELFGVEQKENQASVKDTVAEIEKAESLEQLDQFRNDERKGVIKALEAKETELKGS